MRRRFETARVPALLTAAVVALTACDVDLEDAGGRRGQIASSARPAFISSTAIWWSTDIPVCWENPSSFDVTERAWVRQAVEQTWERVSAVQFVGWGQCAEGDGGIRIEIADASARTLALGRRMDGLPGGMRLNIRYDNWNTGCRGWWRDQCIRVDAVHEFGHALGFSHEQNRPDTDRVACTDAPQGEDGDTLVGPWDADSVMSYCNGRYYYRVWPWPLSSGDTEAVQAMYGGNEHTLVGLGANCLDVAGASTANGARAQMMDCHGGPNQELDVGALRPGAFNPILGYGGKCLDVTDVSTANGAPMQMWDCWGGPNQSFTMNGIALRGLAGKCLDVQWGAHDAGRDVWLWECNGTDAQRFSISEGGAIRRSDGMCLTAAGESDGAVIEMQPCDGSFQQTWSIAGGGAIKKNGSANKCITVKDWGTGNGTPLVLSGCEAGTNQRWSLRGEVRVYGNKCLDVYAFGTADGTGVVSWDCNGSSNQIWQYFP